MTYEEILAKVRAYGQRLTPQRRLILKTLHESDQHLSADAIDQAIRARYPEVCVDMATIYRTLEWLCVKGFATETSLGQGALVYVLRINHSDHHHLVCEQCEGIIEVDSQLFEAVRHELSARYGFSARLEHMAIFGRCRHCQDQPVAG
jgi:Fur family transcriptional regulator, ferric uptake regulator